MSPDRNTDLDRAIASLRSALREAARLTAAPESPAGGPNPKASPALSSPGGSRASSRGSPLPWTVGVARRSA